MAPKHYYVLGYRDLAPSAFALMKESLKCLTAEAEAASLTPTSEAFKLTLRIRWLGKCKRKPKFKWAEGFKREFAGLKILSLFG